MLLSPLKDAIFTAIDLETTGLSSVKDEIIEFGAVKFSRAKVLDTLHLMVKPEKGLKQIAKSINGIEASDLVDAPNLQQAMELIIPFIEGSILIFHNSLFDMAFLEIAARRLKLKFPELPVYCTVHLARKIYPEFKKFNLPFLKEAMKIENAYRERESHFHEAMDDANACAEVFLKCINRSSAWEKTPKETIAHSMGLRTSADYNRILMKKVV